MLISKTKNIVFSSIHFNLRILIQIQFLKKRLVVVSVKRLTKEGQCFFWGAILFHSQSGGDSKEDLARFGYKLNMKVKFGKASFYILGYPLEPCM
jgi:hypothetical protein